MGEARRTEIMDKAVDVQTSTLAVIPVEHREIHRGRVFQSCYTTSALVPNASFNLLFRTATTAAGHRPYVHLKAIEPQNTAGALRFQLIQGPLTHTTIAGAATSVFNHNRNSATTSHVVSIQPWITVGGGFHLDSVIMGGSNAQGWGITQRGPSLEWVLKPSTSYVFSVTNISGTTATMAGLSLIWYEDSVLSTR